MIGNGVKAITFLKNKKRLKVGTIDKRGYNFDQISQILKA
jgi:hypothetical protein